MPYNPHNQYNPNPEWRLKKTTGGNYDLYFLNPTNIIEDTAGSYGKGGKIEQKFTNISGSEVNRITGMAAGNIYQMIGTPEQYEAAAQKTSSEIRDSVTKTFSQMDPNNTTGWQSKTDELSKKAEELYNQNPDTKVFGQVWNDFRYAPEQAEAIAKIQQGGQAAQTAPAQQPQTSAASNPLDPYNTGKVYNQNVNPNEPHYVYNAQGALEWYEPTAAATTATAVTATTPTTATAAPSATGATSTAPAAAPALNFKSGLTDTQKTSITNMLANRASTPLNETDARNLAFALGQADFNQYIGKTSTQLGMYGMQAGVGTTAEAPATGGGLLELPESVIGSPSWQALSPDQQTLIKLYYSTANATSEEQKMKLQVALEEAIKVADPYIKEQISIVKDEIDRNVNKIEGDFTSKQAQLSDRVKQIQEDLIYNKDFLSLEQQSDLAQQLKKYKGDLYNLQQGAAEAGLAFSSPRTQAEQQLKEEQQGMAESTRRKYAQSQRELQVGSERNVQALQQNLADLERARKEGLTELQRKAETTLGSAGAPAVAGVTPLGGITGAIPEQKGQYVTDWTQRFSNNPLNQLLQ